MENPKLDKEFSIDTGGGNYNEHIEGDFLNDTGSHFIKNMQADKVIFINGSFLNNTDIEKIKDSQVSLENNKGEAIFVFTGTFHIVNEKKLKAIEAHLRKISQDIELTILKVEEGSIKITLEASKKSLELLKNLFESGKLTEVLGVPLEDIQILSESSYDENKKLNNKPCLDFSGQNLRGRSFKSQNLEGTDFSGADIRGANFSHAYLRGANFSHAQAGLQRRWAVCLIVVSFFLSMFSGVACGLAGIMTAGIVSPTFLKEYHPVPAGILLVVLIIYYTFVLRRGFIIGLVVCALSLAALISIIGTLTGSLAGSGVAALAVAWAVVGTLAGAIAVVIVKAIASSKTLNVFLLSSGIFHQFWAGASAWVVAGIVAGNAIGAKSGEAAVAKSVNVARVVVGAKSVAVAFVGTDIEIACRFFAIGVACSLVFLGIYTGIQALKIDEKDIVIRRIGIFIAAIGGTNFYQANLTNANFREAILKNTNFTHAILERTCFSWVKKLECSRISATYLKDPQIRKLVITGEAQRQSFNRKDMEGLNLRGANLQEASFIGANLSKTNLQEANLFGAKLVKTRLEQTDFTRAILTGAYIEDWGINIDTKLDHVECQYIYMRFPTKENPNPLRKPDSEKEVFADGDFGDFIKPIFDILDLYHSEGVDPRKIVILFKQLAENNPETNLEIVAIEKPSEDKFLLRAKTSETANKSELSNEYFSTYNQMKRLPEREIQLLLAEKDIRIRTLEHMLEAASNRVVNNINILPSSSEPNKLRIGNLLEQLRYVIEFNSSLSDEDKKDALEHLQALAEVGHNLK